MKFKTVFVVFIVLALCLVGVGFYQGWWVMSSQREEGGGNKVGVKLTIDPGKVKADGEALKAKAGNLTGGTPEKTPAKTSDDAVKPNVE